MKLTPGRDPTSPEVRDFLPNPFIDLIRCKKTTGRYPTREAVRQHPTERDEVTFSELRRLFGDSRPCLCHSNSSGCRNNISAYRRICPFLAWRRENLSPDKNPFRPRPKRYQGPIRRQSTMRPTIFASSCSVSLSGVSFWVRFYTLFTYASIILFIFNGLWKEIRRWKNRVRSNLKSKSEFFG